MKKLFGFLLLFIIFVPAFLFAASQPYQPATAIDPYQLLKEIQKNFDSIKTAKGRMKIYYSQNNKTIQTEFKLKRPDKFLVNCIWGCNYGSSYDGINEYVRSQNNINVFPNLGVTSTAVSINSSDPIKILENSIVFEPIYFTNFSLSLISDGKNITITAAGIGENYKIIIDGLIMQITSIIQYYSTIKNVEIKIDDYHIFNGIWMPTFIKKIIYTQQGIYNENYDYENLVINRNIPDTEFILTK